MKTYGLRRACALLAAALLTTTAVAVTTAVEAKTLRWARSADLPSLDPHAFNNGLNFALLRQMYETLVERHDDGTLIPMLATEWKMLDDPRVWEFKLRRNVRFHDGTPFTARDVVFSINRARGQYSDIKSRLASVEEVRVVDDHTLHIQTKGPNLVLPNNMVNFFIMSEQWSKANNAESVSDPTRRAENGATRALNGTGAYVLASREIDARTVMKRNPDYWGKDEFPMEVSELVYVPIKSAATRIAALLSGEVDFVHDVPPQDVARLKQDARLRVNDGLENRTVFLALNVGATELKSSNVKGKNPLADLRVRQAIDLAIDRDAIQRSVMRGMSNPSGIIVASFVNGYKKEYAAYPKADPARARQLLAEAGYPDGFSITLHSPNDRYVNDEAISTAIAGFLGRIGIKTQVMAQPMALHSATTTGQANSDFYMYGWGVSSYDSAYVFDFLVHTRGKDGRGAQNATGYSNAALDAKIVSLSSESDPVKRDATIDEIWQTVQKERFYIPLHDQVIYFASAKWVNIPVNAQNSPHFKYIKFDK